MSASRRSETLGLLLLGQHALSKKPRTPPDVEGRRLEREAWSIGGSEANLGRCLRRWFARLSLEQQQLFGTPRYDRKAKALVAENGQRRLCWKLRDFPDRPIASENQQFREGVVHYVALGVPHRLAWSDGRLLLLPLAVY
jgi:hypothetical protein